MELIEIKFKLPSRWRAELTYPWGDKTWKVFRNKNFVGQISGAFAVKGDDAIRLTKEGLRKTKRKLFTMANPTIFKIKQLSRLVAGAQALEEVQDIAA